MGRAFAAVQENHFNRVKKANWQKSTSVQPALKTYNSEKASSESSSQCSFSSASVSPPLVLHQLSSAALLASISFTASHLLYAPQHLPWPCCSSHFSVPFLSFHSQLANPLFDFSSPSFRFWMMAASVTRSPISPCSLRIWTPCQSVGPLILTVPWW